MVGVHVVGGRARGWGLVAAHGWGAVVPWLWWAGCRCPWGGFSHCPCVLVMRGDVDKVVVNVSCVSLSPLRLSFVGGGSSLFVDGASLWWAGGRCAWGCRHRPSASWAGVRGVEKATSAAWWWVSLSSLVVPGLLGIRRGECRCRRGTPRWACHVSCLVVGVVVGVCIVDVVDDVDDVGMGLTWRCGGHDGGVGWWRLTTSGGRRGMVVVERKRRVARFVPTFPDLAGTEKVISKH